MKCANEIVNVATIANAEREAERIRRTMMLENNSIKFCEEVIAPKLEEAARNGKTSVEVVVGTDFRGSVVFALVRGKQTYADGSPSYNEGDHISLEVIEMYLKSFCYRMSANYYSSGLWRCYGCGSQRGYKLTISADPTC